MPALIVKLQAEMATLSEAMDFEGAAVIRDKIQAIKDLDLGIVPRSSAALRANAPENASKAGKAGDRGGKRSAGGKQRRR